MVERNLAKVEVASSRLVSRSRMPEGKTSQPQRFPFFVGRVPQAGWQSGHAAACKAVYAGSIPTPASRTIALASAVAVGSRLPPPITAGGRRSARPDSRPACDLAAGSRSQHLLRVFVIRRGPGPMPLSTISRIRFRWRAAWAQAHAFARSTMSTGSGRHRTCIAPMHRLDVVRGATHLTDISASECTVGRSRIAGRHPRQGSSHDRVRPMRVRPA